MCAEKLQLSIPAPCSPKNQQVLAKARKKKNFLFLQAGCKKSFQNICQSQCTAGLLGFWCFLIFLLLSLNFFELICSQFLGEFSLSAHQPSFCDADYKSGE